MRHQQHLRTVSKRPAVAQTNLEIKLQGTTDIIDRLLLTYRQVPWKAVGPSLDGTTDTTGVDGGVTDVTGTEV